MKIAGNILKVTDTYIRLRTVKKRQEIDVFFTATKKLSVETLFEPHMVTVLSVELQTFEVDGNKFAKLWLVWVQSPQLPDFSEFSNVQMNRYHMILPLYDIKPSQT